MRRGAVMLAGLLVACGGDDAPADTDLGSTSIASTGTSTTTTSPSSGSTGTPNPSTDTSATTTGGDTTSASTDTETADDTSTGEPPVDAEFEERDGIVSVEAEHYYAQTNNETTAVTWYTFREGEPAPEVDCVVDTPCTGANNPECNQYPECDPDEIPPAEAAGGAYVEALPDRRRNDEEPSTGNLGVVNDPTIAATLTYRVHFSQTGRYYVWGRARGLGPAANGIHLGIDGTWPDNDLIDPSSMRMQFPNGWVWTQNRRGGSQHTGVSGTDEVSQRDANIWLQIDEPGVHEIQWAMREDGLEFDKFVMVLDPDFEPDGDGPPETAL